MGRYDDFEIACLSDSIMGLGEAVKSGKTQHHHISRLFRELSHVMRLLGEEGMAYECMTLAESDISADASELDELRSIKDIADDLVRKHGVEEIEDLDELIYVPEELTRQEAIEALKAAVQKKDS